MIKPYLEMVGYLEDLCEDWGWENTVARKVLAYRKYVAHQAHQYVFDITQRIPLYDYRTEKLWQLKPPPVHVYSEQMNMGALADLCSCKYAKIKGMDKYKVYDAWDDVGITAEDMHRYVFEFQDEIFIARFEDSYAYPAGMIMKISYMKQIILNIQPSSGSPSLAKIDPVFQNRLHLLKEKANPNHPLKDSIQTRI